jgi:hypothetical protein
VPLRRRCGVAALRFRCHRTRYAQPPSYTFFRSNIVNIFPATYIGLLTSQYTSSEHIMAGIRNLAGRESPMRFPAPIESRWRRQTENEPIRCLTPRLASRLLPHASGSSAPSERPTVWNVPFSNLTTFSPHGTPFPITSVLGATSTGRPLPAPNTNTAQATATSITTPSSTVSPEAALNSPVLSAKALGLVTISSIVGGGLWFAVLFFLIQYSRQHHRLARVISAPRYSKATNIGEGRQSMIFQHEKDVRRASPGLAQGKATLPHNQTLREQSIVSPRSAPPAEYDQETSARLYFDRHAVLQQTQRAVLTTAVSIEARSESGELHQVEEFDDQISLYLPCTKAYHQALDYLPESQVLADNLSYHSVELWDRFTREGFR